MVDDSQILLNFWDHFFLSYCCCCISGRVRKVNDYYNNISDEIDEYTDMLNITNNIFELEKLKYVLMDEDQVALFNSRSKVQMDIKKVDTSSFSKFYYFTKELNEDVKINELVKNISLRETDKKFNQKLVDLIDKDG